MDDLLFQLGGSLFGFGLGDWRGCSFGWSGRGSICLGLVLFRWDVGRWGIGGIPLTVSDGKTM